MIDAEKIAQLADVIIGGFAVLRCEPNYKVVNLNKAQGTAVLTIDGTLIETDMDSIELSIARKTLAESLAYMEAEDA